MKFLTLTILLFLSNYIISYDRIIGKDFATIIGFGSLLSETSARGTFPTLKNFRVDKIRGFRRVYAHVGAYSACVLILLHTVPVPTKMISHAHTASIFLQRGIANIDTKEMASLSAESTGDASDEMVRYR